MPNRIETLTTGLAVTLDSAECQWGDVSIDYIHTPAIRGLRDTSGQQLEPDEPEGIGIIAGWVLIDGRPERLPSWLLDGVADKLADICLERHREGVIAELVRRAESRNEREDPE